VPSPVYSVNLIRQGPDHSELNYFQSDNPAYVVIVTHMSVSVPGVSTELSGPGFTVTLGDNLAVIWEVDVAQMNSFRTYQWEGREIMLLGDFLTVNCDIVNASYSVNGYQLTASVG
jgi:hypothetical protein